MNTPSIRRVIWVVDAFEESTLLQENVIRTLRALSNKCSHSTQWHIEPVYALSLDQLNLPHYAAHFIDQYQVGAKQALDQKLKDVRLPGLAEPKVLIHRQNSLRTLVQHFLHYAEETQTDLIVMGTHGRTGVSRFFIGSFAEALLSTSNLPILITGESNKAESNLSQILHPTELQGELSQSVFAKTLSIAQQLKAKVTLLHSIPRLLEPVFQSGVYLLSGGWFPLLQLSKKEEDKQKKVGNRWVSFGKDKKVEVSLVVDADTGSVVHSILNQAINSSVDLIVIEAQRGPLAAALLGSITRQIVRLAPCPVWILRSD